MFLSTDKKVTLFHALLIILISAFAMGSCTTSKKITYFQDISDSVNRPSYRERTQFTDPRIKANDILQVSIQTIDPSNTSMFGQAAGGNGEATGYLVSKDGTIELPLIGKTTVAGMTSVEATEYIKEKASKYYVSPIVNVKIVNFIVYMLGEVATPGPITINNEKVSIIDAISLAGDLTIQGKRENILLVREENGKKMFIRFDLNSTDIFKSPYFYLKSGDIVYVEPNTAKKRSATVDNTSSRYISYISVSLSIFITVYTLFFRN